MPKGRGANSSRSTHSHSRGSQAGNLTKGSKQILSSRAIQPKYAPTNHQGILDETASLLERLRKRFRRRHQ